MAELVCCTSGEVRSHDAAADPLELAATREREQREAARVLGYEWVSFRGRHLLTAGQRSSNGPPADG
ncbi:MAG: hypothetical protein AB1Z67_11895 [Candidatus Limnocylindrales bacterium]